jgi:hypothetical protein
MNLHIMRMDKNSRLMQRALKLAVTLPLNHPDFKTTMIEKLCKPNGYFQVSWACCHKLRPDCHSSGHTGRVDCT